MSGHWKAFFFLHSPTESYYLVRVNSRMKQPTYLIGLLLLLAIISGYLMSKASLAGKAGIALFYKEYRFLKVWWQGALVVFGTWMLLFLLQGYVQRKAKKETARLTHTGAIVAALVGLYLTYDDFRHTLTHRILGERFHLGGYLFWLGWIIISLYYLTRPQKNLHDTSPAVREERP